MCSICRNPKCKYQFGKDKWKPDEGEVVIQLPDSDLTMLESVRVFEDRTRKMIGVTSRLLESKSEKTQS